MSMRDYLPSWLGGKRSEPVQNASYPTSAITQGSPGWNDLFGSMPALTYPTEDTAFTISAIYASVNLIAGAISGLPMELPGYEPLFTSLTRGAERADEHELELNPRSASVRLRALEKVVTRGGL